MVVTDERRMQAKQIEEQIRQKQQEFERQRDKLRGMLKDVHARKEAAKRKSRTEQFLAGSARKSMFERVDDLRHAAEDGSEMVDLKHKEKDIEHQIHKLEQDTKFQLKEMQKQADKLQG